jgi:hypothetical protein
MIPISTDHDSDFNRSYARRGFGTSTITISTSASKVSLTERAAASEGFNSVELGESFRFLDVVHGLPS